MPYLVLDLDETIFVIEEHKQFIHQSQELSSLFMIFTHSTMFPAYVINRQKLSLLIQEAFDEYDGVIILTAGSWPVSILQDIAPQLILSEENKRRFVASPFFSPEVEADFGDFPAATIKHQSKDIRLLNIRHYNSEFRNALFVLLDDNPVHINACCDAPHVIAIQATTETSETEFYEHAKKALEILSSLERHHNYQTTSYTVPENEENASKIIIPTSNTINVPKSIGISPSLNFFSPKPEYASNMPQMEGSAEFKLFLRNQNLL
ncbi:MAG: NIF family HAD-type phosphatase [Legionella sp.]|uniref:NIF family HAD-type phosphatase n=1 Tax=Legionella sp. TaxID=459 RepID=UPI0039E35A9E